jgi:hypothetical protein
MKQPDNRETKNSTFTAPALWLGMVLTLSACSSAPPATGPITSGAAYETQPGFGGQTIVNTVTRVDTVVSIDTAHRTLELKHPDGRVTAYHCGPEIVNFNQIKVGDRVKATVLEEMAVFLKPGNATESLSNSAVVVRAPAGSVAGYKNVDTLNFTAKIMALNIWQGTVTLQLANGQNRTIHVSEAVNLADFNVGDDVSVQSIDSTSIAVEKP